MNRRDELAEVIWETTQVLGESESVEMDCLGFGRC